MFVLDDVMYYTAALGALAIGGEVLAIVVKKCNNKDDKLATATFGKRKDLSNLLGNNGVQISKNIRLSLKASHEGICIIGPTGAGKSSSIIASNLLNEDIIPGSLVIADPKLELWETTSNYLKYKGYRTILYSPLSPNSSVQYNPLNMCRTTEEVTQLAETILLNGDLSIKLQSGRSSNNGEWVQMSCPLLASALLYFKDKGYPLDNIPQALKFLISNSMEDIDLVFRNSTNEDVKEQYSIFKTATGSSKTASSILITLSSSLKLFLNSNVVKTTMKTEFTAEMLRKEKIALFISIPERYADQYAPLTATIYSQLISQSMDYYSIGRNPITWFWDEFANCGLIPSFTKIVSTTRSRENSFVICLQDLSQLNNIYGKNNTQTILNNLKVKAAMPGLSDIETLEYISNLCGETEVETVSTSQSDNRITTSRSTQRKKLVNADEVRRLGNEEILIIAHNKKVLKDTQNIYYKQKKYMLNVFENELPIN